MPRSEIDSSGCGGIRRRQGPGQYLSQRKEVRGRTGVQSPIVKNISDETLPQILELTTAKEGNMIYVTSTRSCKGFFSYGQRLRRPCVQEALPSHEADRQLIECVDGAAVYLMILAGAA